MKNHNDVLERLAAQADSEHQDAFHQTLAKRIVQSQGWISFSDFMEIALYEPGLGYYARDTSKLATLSSSVGDHAGDFITAPQLSPVFAKTLARQVAQVLQITGTYDVLEFGAGTGALAVELTAELARLGIHLKHYFILEVSSDLKERQQKYVLSQQAQLSNTQTIWLDTLPEAFEGCIIANEVLDAMPVRLFRIDEHGGVWERGISLTADEQTIGWADQAASAIFTATVCERMGIPLPPPASSSTKPSSLIEIPGQDLCTTQCTTRDLNRVEVSGRYSYISEIGEQAEAFVRSLGKTLHQGAILLIDYGFPRHEFYHPQRHQGTLMCHARHQAHSDPLILLGSQDITAHIDFTAIADAALEADLEVLGFTSQARFLLNCGFTEVMHNLRAEPAEIMLQQSAYKLISEAEMGELFKVIAFGKNLTASLIGFETGDRRHRL